MSTLPAEPAAGDAARSARGRVPAPVKAALGPPLHYAQRMSRWGRVLATVSGVSFADKLAIARSAAAAPLTSLKDIMRWQHPVAAADCRVRVRGVGTFEVRGGTDDLWHTLPWREPELTALVQGLPPGGCFVDAGANIGFNSVLASAAVGPQGRVVAFEMIPGTAAVLRRHLEVNGCGNATVVERALSDAPGQTVTAHIPHDRFGLASIAESDRPGESVTVETTTLDAALADVERVDLLKVDLEGAEEGALRGATETLAKTAAVVIEANRGDDAALEMLKDAGFAVRPLGGKDVLAERRP